MAADVECENKEYCTNHGERAFFYCHLCIHDTGTNFGIDDNYAPPHKEEK